MNAKNKMIVVVLGMHRSGTSAITRALQVMGVELGDNLLQPKELNNETGFFEDIDVYRLNEDLLGELGYRWDSFACIEQEELSRFDLTVFRQRATALLQSRLQNCTYFGIKDPRICRLLPFWQQAFAHLGLQVGYVIASRNPMSVARSLQRRDGFELEKGCLLWQGYMLDALTLTAGADRIIVDYDVLLSDPARQIERVASCLGLSFDRESKSFGEYQCEFLRNSLRNAQHSVGELAHCNTISSDGKSLYSLLLALATSDTCGADHDTEIIKFYERHQALRSTLRLLDREENKLLEAVAQISEQSQEIRKHEHLSAGLQAEIMALQAEINQYQTSTSWKITKPLRYWAMLGKSGKTAIQKMLGMA